MSDEIHVPIEGVTDHGLVLTYGEVVELHAGLRIVTSESAPNVVHALARDWLKFFADLQAQSKANDELKKANDAAVAMIESARDALNAVEKPNVS